MSDNLELFTEACLKHLQGKHNQKRHGNRYISIGKNIAYQGIQYKVVDIYSYTQSGPRYASLVSKNGSYKNVLLTDLHKQENDMK